MAIYPVLQTGLLNQSSAQVIDGSLKFVPGSSTHLKKTFPSSGNGRTWTWSCWTKRGNLGSGILIDCSSGSDRFRIRYISDKFDMASDTTIYRQTNALLRDPSAWYHLVAILDTTLDNADADDRVRLYINGVRVTSFNTSNNPSQNNSFILNTNILHQIGELCDGGSNYDGEMSQVYFIDGAALEPENFGFTDPLTNTWRPKKYKHRTDLYGVTWSSALVGDASGFQSAALAADGFDGEVGSSNNQYAQNNTGSNPSTITFTPVGGIKFNSSIQVYLINADNTVNVNGEGAQTIAANQWVTVKTGSGTLNTLVFSRASNGGASFSAIRVDGHILIDAQNDNSFYLPMDGNSPIGNDKSNPNPLNGGTTWSSSASVDSGSSDMTLAFDGDISTATSVGLPSGGATVTFTPPSAITVSIGLRVYMAVDRGQSISVNGTQTNASISAGWNDTGFTGSLTSLVVGPANGGSSNNIAAIEVDGVLLVDGQIGDNNWTPVNFGGSVALDNPQVSGARPILNTLPGGTHAGVGVFGSKEGAFYTATGSTGSGSGYVFDGVSGNNPSFSFIRGATYTFDYSAASGHPLRFSSTDPDSSTTAYTTGTNTATSNVIKFTVPHDAPDNLWYYCTNHSNMNGAISVTTDETKADKYAANCTLALPLVGNAYDVSHLVNSTSTEKAVANTGVEFLSESSNFYGGSAKIFGTDKLNVTESNSDFTFGTSTDFTIECWTLITSGHYYGRIIEIGTVNNNAFLVDGDGPDGDTSFRLRYDYNNVSFYGTYNIVLDKWHHVAAVRKSGTLTLYVDGVACGSVDISTSDLPGGNAQIGNYLGSNLDYDGYIQDLRVYKGVAKYTSNFVPAATSPDILPDTPSGVSGSSELTKITDGSVSFDGTSDSLTFTSTSDVSLDGDFTIEFWAYPNTIVNDTSDPSPITMPTDGSAISQIYIHSSNFNYNLHKSSAIVSTVNNTAVTNRWQHVAFTRSGTTVYAFFNGVLQDTATSSATFGGTSGTFRIGSFSADNGNYDGYMSNVRIIKGTALYTSNFIPPNRALTNVTNTKLLCCQSNTSATEGAVKPGTITANGNATVTTFNPFITDINTVRGQETGYATLNPLNNITEATFADGNLKVTTKNASSHYGTHTSTLSMSSGKHYAEVTVESTQGYPAFGVCDVQSAFTDTSWIGSLNPAISYYGYNGKKYVNGASAATYGSSFGAGNTIGIAVDLDNLTVEFFRDGASQGLITGLTGNTEYFFGGSEFDSGSGVFLWNYGQKPFKFPPPDGFQPLNAANVRPETVIARPDQFVNTTIWSGAESGSGGTTRHINTGNQPDFVWIKQRNQAYSTGHQLYDSVRGAGAEKELNSSGTAQEGAGNIETYGWLNSFDKTGFTVKGGSSDYDYVDKSGVNYVAWTWRAGGDAGTFNKDGVAYASAAAAGLTGGALTVSGCSVGTKQGFSIIKYNSGSTGTNNTLVSHGLGKTPRFIIHKTLSTGDWYVYHADVITDLSYYLRLNSTDERKTAGSNIWGSTSPNSNTFGVRVGNADANPKEGIIKTNEDAIVYVWADVPGLQKFGSYTGNGASGWPNADGPFIELGFRPALVIWKNTVQSENWHLLDIKRDPVNFANHKLLPNSSAQETQNNNHEVDFLSNGFKLRNNNGELNENNDTYIYAAWAEAPAFNLFGGQSNAR